jgi:hypothetical protein
MRRGVLRLGNIRPLTFVLSGISKIAALPQMKAAWIRSVRAGAGVESEALDRLEVVADTFLVDERAGAARSAGVAGGVRGDSGTDSGRGYAAESARV